MTPDIRTALLERVKQAGGYIDFDGKNCDDFGPCSGWDGVSRRCDCGNRRVCWTTSGAGVLGL